MRPFCLTASLICSPLTCSRKSRGRRSRKRASSLDRRSRCWDETSTHEPLLTSSRTSLTSEVLCQATQDTDPLAAGCFVTPVKGYQSFKVDSRNGVSSPDIDRTPLRPLDAAANRSRPPFLSPLHSPRKPRNGRIAKPVRAIMDIFLDSRAGSGAEDESDGESFRDIERRLGMSKYMRTPESPTPPSSRASSRETDSVFSTPTRVSKYFRSPRRRSGFHLLGEDSQENPLKPSTRSGTNKPWTLTTQRDGFWRREAERLRMCAPKVLLPSWHLGLSGQEAGEDTERLMMLADVSLAELELELGPAGNRGYEVSGDRSTVDW